MPDIEKRSPLGEGVEEEKELEAREEETPGHTPGAAEGDDEQAPQREHPYPDPDKTPGCAEGC
ncbi:hypothetical protein P2318_17510 [Myxococcaceae bacterium GXIMD 01537]